MCTESHESLKHDSLCRPLLTFRFCPRISHGWERGAKYKVLYELPYMRAYAYAHVCE